MAFEICPNSFFFAPAYRRPTYPPRRTGLASLQEKKNSLAKAYLRKAGAETQRVYGFSLRLLFFARKKREYSREVCGRLSFFESLKKIVSQRRRDAKFVRFLFAPSLLCEKKGEYSREACGRLSFFLRA